MLLNKTNANYHTSLLLIIFGIIENCLDSSRLIHQLANNGNGMD